MSLIPIFKIGLWNAWIFQVYSLLPILLFTLTKLKSRAPESPNTTFFNSKEKKILSISKIIMFLPMIYSIFLPMKLGTNWFYIGMPITILGLILYTLTWVNLGCTPKELPSTYGLYRYSRHPMYIAMLVADIGIFIACASWLYLLLSILSMIGSVLFVPSEERFLIERYGDAYRSYMNRTPRWIGISKSGKNQ